MSSRPFPHALSDADVDAVLDGRAPVAHADLGEIVELLRMSVPGIAPPPTSELAALLAYGFAAPGLAQPPSAPHGGRVVKALAALLAAAVTTLGAATANALPAPVQSTVAGVVGALTSIELPRPQERADRNADPDVPGAGDQAEGPAPDAVDGRPDPGGVFGRDGVDSQDVDENELDENELDGRAGDGPDVDEPAPETASNDDQPADDQPDVEVPDVDHSVVEVPVVEVPDVEVPDVDQSDVEVSQADEPVAGESGDSEAGEPGS